MGNTMPRRLVERQRILASLRETTKILDISVDSTRSHLSSLYRDEEYLQSRISTALNWIVDDPRSMPHTRFLSALNHSVRRETVLPLELFVELLHLQQEVKAEKEAYENMADASEVSSVHADHLEREAFCLFRTATVSLSWAFQFTTDLAVVDWDGKTDDDRESGLYSFTVALEKVDDETISQRDPTLGFILQVSGNVGIRDIRNGWITAFLQRFKDKPEEQNRFDRSLLKKTLRVMSLVARIFQCAALIREYGEKAPVQEPCGQPYDVLFCLHDLFDRDCVQQMLHFIAEQDISEFIHTAWKRGTLEGQPYVLETQELGADLAGEVVCLARMASKRPTDPTSIPGMRPHVLQQVREILGTIEQPAEAREVKSAVVPGVPISQTGTAADPLPSADVPDDEKHFERSINQGDDMQATSNSEDTTVKIKKMISTTDGKPEHKTNLTADENAITTDKSIITRRDSLSRIDDIFAGRNETNTAGNIEPEAKACHQDIRGAKSKSRRLERLEPRQEALLQKYTKRGMGADFHTRTTKEYRESNRAE